MGNPRDQSWIGQSCGINRDLIRSRVEHRRSIVQRPDAASHGERNEKLASGAADDVKQSRAMLVGG